MSSRQKGHDFNWALEVMRGGGCVRRRAWTEGTYLTLSQSEKRFILREGSNEVSPFKLEATTTLAADWERYVSVAALERCAVRTYQCITKGISYVRSWGELSTEVVEQVKEGVLDAFEGKVDIYSVTSGLPGGLSAAARIVGAELGHYSYPEQQIPVIQPYSPYAATPPYAAPPSRAFDEVQLAHLRGAPLPPIKDTSAVRAAVEAMSPEARDSAGVFLKSDLDTLMTEFDAQGERLEQLESALRNLRDIALDASEDAAHS